MHAMPGVTVEVADRCTGCGLCAEGVCFVDAIHMVDGRPVRTDACRGCGRCAVVCPEGAIEVQIMDEGALREVTGRIGAAVEVA